MTFCRSSGLIGSKFFMTRYGRNFSRSLGIQLGKGGWPYDSELERMIMAGHRVIHTPTNSLERRRPRDIRGMCDTKAHIMSSYVEGGPMVT